MNISSKSQIIYDSGKWHEVKWKLSDNISPDRDTGRKALRSTRGNAKTVAWLQICNAIQILSVSILTWLIRL